MMCEVPQPLSLAVLSAMSHSLSLFSDLYTSELMRTDQEAGPSSTVLVNIEYQHLRRGRADIFCKQLTASDVNDRLVVTKGMAMLMPRANGSEIRVLDDFGDSYQFILSERIGRTSRKPTFQPRAWKSFMKQRGAKSGDCIYFWPEVNEIKGANYRIDFIPFIHGVSPHPEDLGDSNAPPESQEETSDLRTWAAHGGLTL